MIYTDQTILLKGKHKFKKLRDVPPEYLVNLYDQRNFQDMELYKYIADRIDQLRNPKMERPVQQTCRKTHFIDLEAAEKRIRQIHGNDTSDHKKPIRAYLCDCGLYHLTSKE